MRKNKREINKRSPSLKNINNLLNIKSKEMIKRYSHLQSLK
jgi:hypothetical protein